MADTLYLRDPTRQAGALTLDDPTVEDAGGAITGTGALAAQSAAASGAGLSESLSTDGALSAQAAVVAGSGSSESLSTSGALAAQSTAADGTGTSEWVASGTLTADSGIAAGAGASASLATEGAIASQNASASGAGTVGTEAITGAGTLMAQAAGACGGGPRTGEYPKPRRRERAAPPPPRLPPIEIPAPAQPSARIVRSPGPRIVVDPDSPIRDLIIGEMALPEMDGG